MSPSPILMSGMMPPGDKASEMSPESDAFATTVKFIKASLAVCYPTAGEGQTIQQSEAF